MFQGLLLRDLFLPPRGNDRNENERVVRGGEGQWPVKPQTDTHFSSILRALRWSIRVRD